MAAPGQGSFYPVYDPNAPRPTPPMTNPTPPDPNVPPNASPPGADPSPMGSGGGGGGAGGGGTVDWDKFYDMLKNDPMYKQALAFIDASRATDKAQLQS